MNTAITAAAIFAGLALLDRERTNPAGDRGGYSARTHHRMLVRGGMLADEAFRADYIAWKKGERRAMPEWREYARDVPGELHQTFSALEATRIRQAVDRQLGYPNARLPEARALFKKPPKTVRQLPLRFPAAGELDNPTIALVACAGSKLGTAAPALELYSPSDLFRKASTYAAKNADRWFILSARHGLVEPGQRLAPYDCTLNAMPAAERRQWAASVARQLAPLVGPDTRVLWLAGEHYRRDLAAELRRLGVSQQLEPLAHLGIGQQKAWLAAHT